MFSKGKGSILKQEIDILNDDIRVMLVDSGYAFDDTDQFVSDITAGAEIARSGAMAGKTVSTDGVFDATDTTLTAVSGDTVANCIIFQHTGADGTARLISFHEGVDVVPNGQDITVVWSSGASKIFKL